MIQNFFNISDLTKNQIIEILLLKAEEKLISKKNIGLLFEKNSTRTRLSFFAAINSLDGHPIEIKLEELNFSRGESFEDTFRAMDCYLDGLVYRTTNHKHLIEASKFFSKPIINALSDISHPCQILSDLFTLREHFGSLNIQILWVGDMNNVCFSLVEVANLINDINLIIYTPSSISNEKNWIFHSNISIINSLEDIDLSLVNCVMTDVFISMNDKDSAEKIKLLKEYTVNKELISKTGTNSVFMHCLPAKVGFEVSEEVFRGPKSIVWRQAYNRLVAQKKLLQFIYQ